VHAKEEHSSAAGTRRHHCFAHRLAPPRPPPRPPSCTPSCPPTQSVPTNAVVPTMGGAWSDRQDDREGVQPSLQVAGVGATTSATVHATSNATVLATSNATTTAMDAAHAGPMTLILKIKTNPRSSQTPQDWRCNEELIVAVNDDILRVRLDRLPAVGGCCTVAVKLNDLALANTVVVRRNVLRQGVTRHTKNWHQVRVKEWRVVRDDTNLVRLNQFEQCLFVPPSNLSFGQEERIPVIAWRSLTPGVRGGIKRFVDCGFPPRRSAARAQPRLHPALQVKPHTPPDGRDPQ